MARLAAIQRRALGLGGEDVRPLSSAARFRLLGDRSDETAYEFILIGEIT